MTRDRSVTALVLAAVVVAGTLALVAPATAAAAGNVAVVSSSVGPSPVTDAKTTTTRTNVTVNNVSKDGNTDTVYVRFPDNVSLSSPSATAVNVSNGAGISITSSAQVVDGPDADGVQDTVTFAVSPTGGGAVTVQFRLAVATGLPDVNDDVAVTIESRVEDSTNGTVGFTGVGSLYILDGVRVSGTVTDANGNPAASDTVEFEGPTYERNVTDANGNYGVIIKDGEEYEVAYRQSDGPGPGTDYPKDGSADLYSFGTASYSSDTTGADYQVPTGYRLNVSVVDPNGNAIGDARVYVSHQNGEVRESAVMLTRSDGLGVPAIHTATGLSRVSSGPGLEVTTANGGEIDVNVEPPSGKWSRNTTANSYQVTGKRSLEFTLYPAAVVTGTVTYGDGSAASNVTIGFHPQGGTDTWYHNQTNDAGGYRAQVATSDWESYGVVYQQRSYRRTVQYPKDGFVDIYAFGTEAYASNGTINRQVPAGHKLDVTVVDENGTAIQNATVDVFQEVNNAYVHMSPDMRTNSNGVAVHPDSDGTGAEVNGTVGVHARKSGYRSNGTQVTLNASTGARSVTIVLKKAVTVSGTVTEADGSAAAGDLLRFRSSSDGSGNVTSSAGAYGVELVPGTTYAVFYEQDDPRTTSDVAYPNDGTVDIYAFGNETYSSSTTVDRRLPVGHTLNVTVVNTSGVPIEDARVRIADVAGRRGVRVRANTTADGLFRHPESDGFGLEVNGTVRVYVEKPGYNTSNVEVTVTGDRELTLTLQKQASISGQVLYNNGTHVVSDEYVVANGPRFRPVPTASDGTYTVGDLVAGDYTLTYLQLNSSFQMKPHDTNPDVYYMAEVTASGSTDAGTTTLPSAHVVNVTVVDPTGTPVENAGVGVRALGPSGEVGSGFQWLNVTDADGLFEAPGKNHPGVELVGHYTIQAVGPPNSTAFAPNVTERNVSISSRRNLTVTVTRTDVTPESHDFGVTDTETPKTVDVTVTNNGDFRMSIAGTSIVGADPGPFTVVSGGGSVTLQPGESTTVTVEFDPPGTASYNAKLRFENPQPAYGPPLEVPLSGSGTSTSDSTETATPTPTPTPTEEPVDTPTDTETDTPTDTPLPTDTPADTTEPATPTPTSTGSPGFGLLVAVVALLAALLAIRRQ